VCVRRSQEISTNHDLSQDFVVNKDNENANRPLMWIPACAAITWLSSAETFTRLGSYLNWEFSYRTCCFTFFVIRQVIVRSELDLSAKELQEKIRSGDASATEIFELGAVMLRKKFYPAAIKYLQQAKKEFDRHTSTSESTHFTFFFLFLSSALYMYVSKPLFCRFTMPLVLATSVMRSSRRESINLKDLKDALKAFEEVLLFDPNNKLALRRRDALKERVQMYKVIPMKSSIAEKSLPPWNVNLFAQK
ncbi:hypothetical protein MKW92_016362, partial [Papaver armeniacum]